MRSNQKIPKSLEKEIVKEVNDIGDRKNKSGRLLRWKYQHNIGLGVLLAKKKGLSEDQYVKLVQDSTKAGLKLGKLLLGLGG